MSWGRFSLYVTKIVLSTSVFYFLFNYLKFQPCAKRAMLVSDGRSLWGCISSHRSSFQTLHAPRRCTVSKCLIIACLVLQHLSTWIDSSFQTSNLSSVSSRTPAALKAWPHMSGKIPTLNSPLSSIDSPVQRACQYSKLRVREESEGLKFKTHFITNTHSNNFKICVHKVFNFILQLWLDR